MKRNDRSRKSRSFSGLEPLESRRFLSVAAHGGGGHEAQPGGGSRVGLGGMHGQQITTVEFDQAPALVQTGLTSLAAADGLTAPAATQKVSLADANGVESYSLTFQSTGTVTKITVDIAGNPLTPPTSSTTTFADLGMSAPAAATEITAIATAESYTAPTGTTSVKVTTTSGRAATYTVTLVDADGRRHVVSVDATGNAVGEQRVTFSVLSAAVQAGINANLPTGATALAADSTQSVHVQTFDGMTLYTTAFTTDGTTTTVTVNTAGALTSLPSTTTTTFDTLSTAVQTAIQALATANGVTDAIATTTTVTVYTEANGTVLYSVNLAATGTSNSGEATSFNLTITVDANGNPTTLPRQGGQGDRPRHGMPGGLFGGGDDGDVFWGGGDDSGDDNSGSAGSGGDDSGGQEGCGGGGSTSGGDDSGDDSSGSSSSGDDGDDDGSTTSGGDDGSSGSSDSGDDNTRTPVIAPPDGASTGQVASVTSTTGTTTSTKASAKATAAEAKAAKAAKAAAAKSAKIAAKAAAHTAKVAAAAAKAAAKLARISA